MKPFAVCLMGPTAVGKTDLALSLMEDHPFEIVSVDSALVYRGMDVGTAKPAHEVLAKYPHHLIDIRDPADSYSAADFRDDALRVMEEVAGRGRTPLLVGGTMLYFKALREGLADLPAADPEVRARITELARREGWAAVHETLSGVDPQAAGRIHPNDPQRLQRALEIYEITGRSMTELQRDGQESCPWQLCQIGIVPEDRALLHARIEQRFMAMLSNGLVAEVERLRARGDLDPRLPSMKAVGYRQVWAYLDGDSTFEEMAARGIAATRQLAKRQLTWMRRWPGLNVISDANPGAALKILESGSILG